MKDDRVYLSHIQDSIRRILAYTTGGEQAFLDDTRTQNAVIRNLEIIGEAAKMRDKMVHDYIGVIRLVWEVVEKDLPTLERRLDDPEGPWPNTRLGHRLGLNV